MKMMNIRPTAIKIDTYLNVDAGTMSPFEHGEVFVLDDGGETDLDLGNYERFLDVRLTSDSNLTTGKCYQAVIAKERKGEYLGKTVQIIPHVTNEIMERIIAVSESPVDDSHNEPDVCVIELGGTIGDIESMPFVEALRQLQLKVAPEDFCLIHVSMVPIIGESGEQKTKPTQHSVKELRSLGLAPDFIVCRSPVVVETGSREKIALFCNVPKQNVLSIHDVRNIYHVPLLMLQQDLHTLIRKRLLLDEITSTRSQPQSVEPTAAAAAAAAEDSLSPPSLLPSSIVSSAGLNQAVTRSWERMTARIDATKDEAVIALVGKYTINKDAYLSVIFALRHACMGTDQKLRLEMIESSHLEEHTKQNDPDLYVDAWRRLKAADGVLVPGELET
jgi:CTP synthase